MPNDDEFAGRLKAALRPPDLDVEADLIKVRECARRKRRRKRGVVSAGAGLAMIVLVALVALTLDRSHPRNDGTIIATQDTRSRPNVAGPSIPPDTPTIPKSRFNIFPIRGNVTSDIGAHALAVGSGSVWLAVDGKIERLDASSGEVDATITLPDDATPFSLAFGPDGLWSVNNIGDLSPEPGFARTVTLIDPSTNAVRFSSRVPDSHTPGNAGQRPRITASDGAGWVTNAGRLYRFDARSGQHVATILVPGPPTYTLVAGSGATWLVQWGGTIQRVDDQTNEVTEFGHWGEAFSQSSAISGHALWVTHGDNPSTPGGSVLDLLRVDLKTGQTRSTGLSTSQIAAGGGEVWVAGLNPDVRLGSERNQPDLIGQLDPITGHIRRIANVPASRLHGLELAVESNAVWALNIDKGTLTRIAT